MSTGRYGISRGSVENIRGAAEQLAVVYEGLGPQAAAVAAAAALLTSPTTLGALRRVAVGVTATVTRHPARDRLLETELLRLWILSLPPGAHITTVKAPQ
jgi:hypothetical protein